MMKRGGKSRSKTQTEHNQPEAGRSMDSPSEHKSDTQSEDEELPMKPPAPTKKSAPKPAPIPAEIQVQTTKKDDAIKRINLPFAVAGAPGGDPGDGGDPGLDESKDSSSTDTLSDDGVDDDCQRDAVIVNNLENKEEAQLIEWDDGTVFDENLHQKFMSFGLTEAQADLLIRHGATTSSAFARLFETSALDDLFDRDGLDDLTVLTEQQIRVFHKWLRQCQDRGVRLDRISLSRFNDSVMASLLDTKEAETSLRGWSGSRKDSGLSLPTFNGQQKMFKVFDTNPLP
jgi:hypothetical protein